MALRVKTNKPEPKPETPTKTKAGAFWLSPKYMGALRPKIDKALADGETVTAFIVSAIEAELKRRTA